MPKDYTTLSSEITDPAIKRELQQEADLRKAELALSRLDSELAAGGEALKKMPAIEGELAALRKMLDRPLSVQATLAQHVAEASIKRPDILGSLRTAVTAEFIRRVNRTDPEKTIAELLPDDANRLRRKHARHMLGRKSGIETGSTASPLWGREIT